MAFPSLQLTAHSRLIASILALYGHDIILKAAADLPLACCMLMWRDVRMHASLAQVYAGPAPSTSSLIPSVPATRHPAQPTFPPLSPPSHHLHVKRDRKFKQYVDQYAKDEDKFFADFAAAFGKLLALGVPNQGP